MVAAQLFFIDIEQLLLSLMETASYFEQVKTLDYIQETSSEEIRATFALDLIIQSGINLYESMSLGASSGLKAVHFLNKNLNKLTKSWALKTPLKVVFKSQGLKFLNHFLANPLFFKSLKVQLDTKRLVDNKIQIQSLNHPVCQDQYVFDLLCLLLGELGQEFCQIFEYLEDILKFFWFESVGMTA